MNAKMLADLFDVPLEDGNSEVAIAEGDDVLASADTSGVLFQDKCEDLKAVMKHEPVIVKPEAEKKTTKSAKSTKSTKAVSEPIVHKEPDLDVVAEVERDIQDFKQDAGTSKQESDSVINDNSACSSENPLGLSIVELQRFNEIKEQYPQFTLDDGSLSFRDFYRSKFHYLNLALTRFPILELKSIREEFKDVNVDHFIGDEYISPELVQKKLDNAYRCRTRVSSLLITMYEQYYLWKRFLDMLRSKLWKDHDIKGSHRRDGTILEHLSDVECYFCEMEGVMESGKHIDGILKAATDSLSRQLTCLQLREHAIGKRLESLDRIDTGTVVSAPKATAGPVSVSYGKEDDMSELGA